MDEPELRRPSTPDNSVSSSHVIWLGSLSQLVNGHGGDCSTVGLLLMAERALGQERDRSSLAINRRVSHIFGPTVTYTTYNYIIHIQSIECMMITETLCVCGTMTRLGTAMRSGDVRPLSLP